MTKKKVAINGFGRIGRLVLRALMEDEQLECVGINDLSPIEMLRYSMQYDSTHGVYGKTVTCDENHLIIDGHKIPVSKRPNISDLPWKEWGVDYVVEATGRWTNKEDAEKHLGVGAQRVLISAPAKGDVKTVVMGVNHQEYDPKVDKIVSNASCTTNCLAPVVKVILDNYGLEEGLMTTVHAVTATQPTVDGQGSKNLRSSRGGYQNIIPASTGAAKAVALCLPQVAGKLTGMAFRVPVPNVSVVDLTVKLEKETNLDHLCATFKAAAEGPLKGVLRYTDDELVSSDLNGDLHSSIFDAKACMQLNSRFFKLVSWYDNERGYAQRVVDMLRYMRAQEG